MKIFHENHTVLTCYRAEFTATPRTADYLHWHENMEFLYLYEDGLRVWIDGVTYEPQKGDLIFIRDYAEHRFICERPIQMALGQMALPLLLAGNTNITPIRAHIRAQELAQDPLFHKRFTLLTETMKTIGTVRKGEDVAFAKSVFSAFYFALMEKFPEALPSDTLKEERREFYKIIEYINENSAGPLTVTSLSQALYMDRGKLSRLFTKYARISPSEYINSLRIRKANELFEGGCSVTDAALECGFQTIRTFNNVYKSYMGITPTQYINKNGRG